MEVYQDKKRFKNEPKNTPLQGLSSDSELPFVDLTE
jgi:hypothetical protein